MVMKVPRAQRFPIQAVMRYRIRGQRSWREGVVENISASGLLFQGEQLVEPDTQIELNFILPGKSVGEKSARVVGRGMIVRSSVIPGVFGAAIMAATITHSRLVRP
ncbi:MAG: PilZ domain-containing protein [Acidobacteriota bacterium]|nr:PilZ domain-containing protein [Acidobacteriota bacterium]